LEVHAFLELEKKELMNKYIEQSTQIMASAGSKEVAKNLLNIIREEFFVGFKDTQKRQDQTRIEELIALQNYSFQMTQTKAGGVLEIKPNRL